MWKTLLAGVFRLNSVGALRMDVAHDAQFLTAFTTQMGVATTAELLGAGMSARSIARARQRGAIVPLLPGVFVLAGAEPTFETKAMAAPLHCGPRSFLTGTTAAALYGFRSMPRQRIEVTVPANSWVNVPQWIRVRRAAWIDPDDVMMWSNGLRVASPLLTLFDLASDFNDFRFARAAEDAWHLKLVDPGAASDYLAKVRRSGRGGVARFQSWLKTASQRPRPAASGLELDVIDAIGAAGLPDPERQHRLRLLSGDYIHIDVAWPAIRLGVEPGHSWWHGGDLQARRDAARDRACGELGWLIVRLDESMKDDMPAVGRQLKRIYDSRRNPPAAG